MLPRLMELLRYVANLARPIMESLRLGFSNSKIQKRCILEGELVVYSHLVCSSPEVTGTRTDRCYRNKGFFPSTKSGIM